MRGIDVRSVAQMPLFENCDVDSVLARLDLPIVQQLLHQHTLAVDLLALTIVKKSGSDVSADSAE